MKMLTMSECFELEKEQRLKIDPNSICTFGIPALDDALIGLLRNDLVIIGADSGVGKSQLCLDMALHNAKNGKKVALYFIEGGAIEASARLKWKLMLDIYYSNQYMGVDMDYRKWRLNMINNDIIKDIEQQAVEIYKQQTKDNLKIYYFEKGFKINDLTDSLGYFLNAPESLKNDPFSHKYDIDMIIIDHLQYFNLDAFKSELQEMTDILMSVKDITNHKNIPVVLVSHLRKKDKDRGLPNQEDFYGTSNIAKISSIAITISPNVKKDDYSKGIYPTFFRIAKSRTGLRSSYAMLCNFNSKKQDYSNDYTVYRLHNEVPEGEPLEYSQLPKWAKKQEPKYNVGQYKQRVDIE